MSVETADGRLEIGAVETILSAVGGPAWTIQYTGAEKQRYPTMDTSDEGLTVDVVDMIASMEHSERFVSMLSAQPKTIPDGGDLSPRTGLFVGKLLENLENGIS
ncbi:hypothetical protein VB773_15770 [Haloarculaceae archaeon H-GB2-1]|nr:hypothetical protein [Haloarculaceae archaeon H-GB1-1]MEA5408879.1 hypothetical protein [Haloarculaceae archaeon H-GB2-1]